MALNIKDPEAHKLAAEVAKMTGGTMTEAVVSALREAKRREEKKLRGDFEKRVAEGMAIVRHSAALPLLDTRSADEILGYDENGIPG